MKSLRVAIAQINSTVGDLGGNSRKIVGYIKKAKRRKADIVVFPELAVTGYPPEDLLHKPRFISDNLAELKRIISCSEGIISVVGFVDRSYKDLYNAAAVIKDRKTVDIYHKILLPNYGVFDEYRYFKAGEKAPLYNLNNIKTGIGICEDIWDMNGPLLLQAQAGAEIIININASPYEIGKPERRQKIISEWSSEHGVVIAYVNSVGGQDELVFDGFSMAYDHEGRMMARGRQFEEELVVFDIDIDGLKKFRKGRVFSGMKRKVAVPAVLKNLRITVNEQTARKPIKNAFKPPQFQAEEEIYSALVLGTSDYVRKNNFKKAVIGLSGGVDSSLVASVAVDALGEGNVTGLFMPSKYTSKESSEDAFELAAGLGIKVIEIRITRILNMYLSALSNSFKGTDEDITEENLQARIRGSLLMAFSNKFGWLVLTTGNKSEMSVGYATLYGDMAGGFAVIKDVPKMLVYDLCRWRNSRGKTVIPERVLWKEPTAELKFDQKDSDTLPPYQELDPVLKAYVEENLGFEEILKKGCADECVKKVISMVDRSEYKRRQSPPGIKITSRAFGRDRRFPITNRYRSY